MTWPLFLVESREAAVGEYGYVPVGAVWPRPEIDANAEWISDFYRQNHAGKRPVYMVMLPCGEFCIDSTFYNPEKGYHGGWHTSGEAPNFEVSPSINIVKSYHGHVQNGVVTADCEGRTFPNARGRDGRDGRVLRQY